VRRFPSPSLLPGMKDNIRASHFPSPFFLSPFLPLLGFLAATRVLKDGGFPPLFPSPSLSLFGLKGGNGEGYLFESPSLSSFDGELYKENGPIPFPPSLPFFFHFHSCGLDGGVSPIPFFFGIESPSEEQPFRCPPPSLLLAHHANHSRNRRKTGTLTTVIAYFFHFFPPPFLFFFPIPPVPAVDIRP